MGWVGDRGRNSAGLFTGKGGEGGPMDWIARVFEGVGAGGLIGELDSGRENSSGL